MSLAKKRATLLTGTSADTRGRVRLDNNAAERQGPNEPVTTPAVGVGMGGTDRYARFITRMRARSAQHKVHCVFDASKGLLLATSSKRGTDNYEVLQRAQAALRRWGPTPVTVEPATWTAGALYYVFIPAPKVSEHDEFFALLRGVSKTIQCA